ncbi:ABC transporter ATP-binding protein [Longispora albida]|uniref:ABC transporter ATP-binding protein n=1 Tax=Longispora albida TaxID=203523 RepID=UPI00036A4FD9|nr:ABC transporter ATP-binding protein [Longispora albida]
MGAGDPSRRELVRAGRLASGLVWRADRGTVGWYVLLTVVMAGVPVAAAWLTKLLFDALTGGAGLRGVLWLAGGVAATGAAAAVVPQVVQYVRSELDRSAGLAASDGLFRAVEGFAGLARFEDPAFLDRLRLAQQGAQAPGGLVDSGLGVVRSVLTLGGLLGSLFVLSPVITVVVLLAGVPMFVAELALSRRRARMMWTIGPVERREFFYSQLLGTVDAAKEIRLFGIGSWLRGRMLAERRTALVARRAQDRREMLVQAGLGVLGAVVAGAGMVWAVAGARAGSLSIGDISMFVAAVASVQGAVQSLVTDVTHGHQSLLVFSHYAAVVDAGPDLAEPEVPAELPVLRRGIELRDVWFRYAEDQPWILRGVDLVIPHGAAVALVGLNGAGKSTLVKLLCRFYDPVRGAILWDGVDLRDVPVAELRQRIGAVFQDYMEYDLTAGENIAVGDLSAVDDRARLEQAARWAGIHERLAALPSGYETLLSRIFVSEADKEDPQTGVVLSGGQWQRLALARAFLREGRDLMILDEPSAGLDAEAEHEVHVQLKRHRAGRTSLLISHRLGAVRDADLIVTLEGGRVVEQGGHAVLSAGDGPYARLFRLQAAGYQAS